MYQLWVQGKTPEKADAVVKLVLKRLRPSLVVRLCEPYPKIPETYAVTLAADEPEGSMEHVQNDQRVIEVYLGR